MSRGLSPTGELDIVLPAGRFERFADGTMRTTLADGSEVMAVAGASATDVARAECLGYDGDTDRMSLDHELVHLLLANWLGLPEPPTYRGIVEAKTGGTWWSGWRKEEAAVLAIQALAREVGVDIVALAKRATEKGTA
ncbi:hypothetical protein [Aureimonas glaciei]|uniref:Uncharacterized protein n=1 Tax=Aureimonas glaciei TaxID=1776957 RepID=A0A917DEX0_9HYPH|nr:hypothetical protein [Aureimonas glaciei]GGD31338.1 hypothetical protein GCM10011335_37960 [Aureimonas glaciei]